MSKGFGGGMTISCILRVRAWAKPGGRRTEEGRAWQPTEPQPRRKQRTVKTPWGLCITYTASISGASQRTHQVLCMLGSRHQEEQGKAGKAWGKAQGHILVRKEEQSSINGSTWFHLHQSHENISRYSQQVTPKPQQATKCQRQVFVMFVMYVLVRSESWRKKLKPT